MTKPTCEDTFLSKRRDLKNEYYSLTFQPYSRVDQCRPGHFVHLLLPSTDVYFRRAFSVAGISVEKRQIEIILKAVGRGTRLMAKLRRNDRVNLLGPLGVPFKLPAKKGRTIMVAGGIGLPPLLYLASEMIKKGHNPRSIEFFYGGRSSVDIIERSRIKKLGVSFQPVTEDGSMGEREVVTQPVEEFLSRHRSTRMRIYGCGPGGMLKATDELGLKYGIPGQLSLEAPMPCGIGVCLGCVVPLSKGGYARVCRDGPVFDIGVVAL